MNLLIALIALTTIVNGGLAGLTVHAALARIPRHLLTFAKEEGP